MEIQQINKKINETKTLLYKAYDSLLKQDQVITAHLIKMRFLGTDQQHHTLTHLLKYHHQISGALKYGTMKNYTTTEIYLKDYIKSKHHASDIYLKLIDYQFTLRFETFLRLLPGLQNNGVMKHMERFKKLMRLAEHLDWIEKNPTKRFKLRFNKADLYWFY